MTEVDPFKAQNPVDYCIKFCILKYANILNILSRCSPYMLCNLSKILWIVERNAIF
jgi:hypothetical protein